MVALPRWYGQAAWQLAESNRAILDRTSYKGNIRLRQQKRRAINNTPRRLPQCAHGLEVGKVCYNQRIVTLKGFCDLFTCTVPEQQKRNERANVPHRQGASLAKPD